MASDMIESDVRRKWRDRELQMAGLSVSAVGNQPFYDGTQIGNGSAARDIKRVAADEPISDGTIDGTEQTSGENFYIKKSWFVVHKRNLSYHFVLCDLEARSLNDDMRSYLVRDSVTPRLLRRLTWMVEHQHIYQLFICILGFISSP